MKEYSLFLDESGDFSLDVDNKEKNECLVAGYYIEGTPTDPTVEESGVRKKLLTLWRKAVDTLPENRDACFGKINHAVSIKGESFSKYLAPVAMNVFSAMKESGAEFVIFENNKKAHVIDSNILYLNILAEGVIDTLAKLWRSENEPVKLHVCIGARRDTVNSKPGKEIKIKEDEYLSRLREKLTLQKEVYPDVNFRKCKFEIWMMDDKRDARMVVCDYLCNLYFTRNSDFLAEYQKEYEAFFKGVCKYHMGENRERDRINTYLEKRMYESLLLELCYGSIEDTHLQKSATEAFRALGSHEIKNAYEAFGTHIDDIVTGQRNFELSKRLLDNASKLLDEVKDNYADAGRTEYDIEMYRATLYSHMGDIMKQGEALKKSREIYKNISYDEANRECRPILDNRCALYENYTYNHEKADEICRKDEDLLFAQLDLMLPDDRDENRQPKSDQLAKMYGTHAQVALCLYNEGKADYDYVNELTDKSIAYFKEKRDIARQYQVKADLEADSGNIEKALDFIAKGADVTSWRAITPAGKNDYIGYHLSRIALAAQKKGDVGTSRLILKKYEPALEAFARDFDNKTFEHDSVMPDCISAFNFALVQTYLGGTKYIPLIEKIAETVEKNRITFYPQLAAEEVLCRTDANRDRWSRPKDTAYLIQKINALLDGEYPEATKDFYRKWRDRLADGSREEFISFAKTRLY